MQMLVYEYIPNGSVSAHLHGNFHCIFYYITLMYDNGVVGNSSAVLS